MKFKDVESIIPVLVKTEFANLGIIDTLEYQSHSES